MTRQELIEWRQGLGLRQSDVAAMFGESEADIRNYESGRKAIDAKIIRKVARERNVK